MKIKKTKKTKKKETKKRLTKTKKSIKEKSAKVKKHNVSVVDDIDDIAKVINRIQVDKVPVRASLSNRDMCPTIENILRDSNLTWELRITKKKVYYKIHPNFDEIRTDINVRELEDEFLEDGQLF
jgi:seryl-tRNA synthetase